MNYKEKADEIVKFSGGKENIKEGMHCFTRIRFYLVDDAKADLDKLASIPGIVGAQFQNGQLQVIVGNDVGKVFDEVKPYLNENMKNDSNEKSNNILDALMTTVANIFTPILPAIIGAGLMKGIISVLVMLGVIVEGNSTYNLLTIIADTSFNFLPFLIAVSSAKKFKVNEYLALVLAGALFYPSMLDPEVSLNLFGLIEIEHINYAASVIPIILGVYTMKYVYKVFDKIVPNVVGMIFTPLLTLVVMIPLLLIVFGPLGSTIGGFLADGSIWLADNVPALYGVVLGGLYPLIIMTGMHYAFFPIMLENVAHLGFENGFLPISVFANMAMAGATIAVVFWSKQQKQKEIALSSGISAIFGVTEPALYGVALKAKKPLYAAMITGGLVSAVAVTLGIKMYTFLSPSILSLPIFLGKQNDTSNFIIAIIGVIVSFILAFLLSSVLLRKMKTDDNDKDEETPTVFKNVNLDVYAPMSGEVMNLKDAPDATFADGLVGKGVVIIPDENENKVRAAFDGEVTMLTPTNHAIGITSEEGVELMIHVGLDTVNLNGKGFILKVKQGQKIKKGDILLEFDSEFIKKHEVNMMTPVIVLNYDQFLDVVHTEEKHVQASEDKLLMVIK